jgi:hypothetical protein
VAARHNSTNVMMILERVTRRRVGTGNLRVYLRDRHFPHTSNACRAARLLLLPFWLGLNTILVEQSCCRNCLIEHD